MQVQIPLPRTRLSRRFLLAGAGAATLLASCRSSPPGPAFAALTYAHKGVFRLQVERVEIATDYAPPMRRPNIDHEAPVSPLETMQRWARERLQAVGGPEHFARFVVRDASLKESELPRTSGVRGALTTDQAERYDLSLSAAIEIRQTRAGFVDSNIEARTTRFRTVKEGITLAERDRSVYELIEQGMNDIDAELDRQLRSHLARFVVL